MKLSRIVVTLSLAALVGLLAAGTAEAAGKKISRGRSYQIVHPTPDGKGPSFNYVVWVLKLWKSGYRYWD